MDEDQGWMGEAQAGREGDVMSEKLSAFIEADANAIEAMGGRAYTRRRWVALAKELEASLAQAQADTGELLALIMTSGELRLIRLVPEHLRGTSG